jgi:hypothetical protein
MRYVAVCFCLLALTGCTEPVLDAERDALPGEVAGVPKGPTHRPGQPCTLCHSSEGGQTPVFTVAGTLYQKLDGEIPIEGADIAVTDANGSSFTMQSNCVGTFYVDDNTWNPSYPLQVNVTYGQTTVEMLSYISQAGVQPVSSCAICHSDPASASSPGHLYLDKDPSVPDLPIPAQDCGRGPGGQ